MEFEHSEKVGKLQERVEAFMVEHIYPNEEELFAQVNEDPTKSLHMPSPEKAFTQLRLESITVSYSGSAWVRKAARLQEHTLGDMSSGYNGR
jgi:hypothetical protein